MIYFSGGTNTFTNVTASGNGTASGVIYISGGNLIIRGGTFTNNAITENGGVLCVKSNTKNVTIEKYIDGETEKAAIFTENSAKYGGAISVEGGTVAISGAEFTSNTASKSGGAVYVSGGTVTISDAKFTSNSVPQTTEYVNVGGAIAVGSATLTVENSSFTGNSAFSGGAIGTLDATDPKLTVSGCTFEENVAYKNGGAFFVQTQPATEEERILIDGCTFIGNDSGIAAGSALYMRYTSTVTISNVVAYNGTTAWGGDFYATTNSKFTFRGTVQLKETESSTADTVTFGSSATAVVEYKDDAEKAAWEAVLGTGSKITYTLIETEQEGGEQEGEDPVE